MVACPFRAQVFPYRMLTIFIFILYVMFNVCGVDSAFISLPVIIFLIEKHVEFSIDKQKECFRLSNSFSFRCLRPDMNHLPPVWWSTFGFQFLNYSWCVSLIWRRDFFLFIFAFDIVLIHYPSCAYHLLSRMFLLWNSFLYWVLLL